MEPNLTKAIADFLANDFEAEMQTTLNVLEAVPPDHLDYSPDSKSKNGLGWSGTSLSTTSGY